MSYGMPSSYELTKRGFHVHIDLEQVEYKHGKQGFDLTSDEFQTTPVLFKTIHLEAFNSDLSVEVNDHNEVIANIWIRVDAQFEHFESGRNGVTLFDFHCKVNTAHDRTGLYDMRIS